MSLFYFVQKYYRIRVFFLPPPSTGRPLHSHISGGAPISLDTECFSIYSLISILTIFSSESKSASARVLPVLCFSHTRWAKEKKGTYWSSGIFIPALALFIESETKDTASSCPITRSLRISSILRSFSLSLSASLVKVSQSNGK